MKTCSNQHSNEDDAKFCEHCGVALSDMPDAEQDEATSETDDQQDDVVVVAVDDVSQDDPSNNSPDVDDVVDVLDPVIVSADDLIADDDDTNTVFIPSTPIEDVIRDLRLWADENKVSDDPYVSGLLDAVQSRSDLGAWAAMDPIDVLPDPVQPTTTFRRIIRTLSIVRNMLVFLPVGLTWMAIAQATDAYKDWIPGGLETAEPGSLVPREKNFLDFWTGGGDGALSSSWTLPHIARLDFFLILGIIALSFLISTLSTRCDTLEQRLSLKEERKRTQLAIRIKRALHGKREASPESIAESLGEALADLTQTTRDMAEVAGRLERASNGVQALTPKLDALNDSAAIFANQTAQSIAMAVNSLVQSVDHLNSSVAGNVTSVFESAVANLQEVGEQLARTSASVEYGTKLLKDDIESIRQGLRK